MNHWTEWELLRRQVAIGGWVTNESGQGVKDLAVDIIAMPEHFSTRVAQALASAEHNRPDLTERPDRATTRENGGFYFLDLPAGRYSLKVIDPVSGWQDEKQAIVQWDKSGKVNKVMLRMQLHQ